MGLRIRWAAWVAVLAIAGLGAVLGARPAHASMVEALDLPTLVQLADDVLLAEVTGSESHYDDRGRIVTDVKMRVQSSEKGGRAAGSIVTVRRLGGTVGDIGMRVEGEPTFDAGEQVLLFGSRAEPGGSLLRPVGMSQGAMRIVLRDGVRWVRSAVSGAALVTKSADGRLLRAQAAMEQPRKLDDVLHEIRTLVQKK